MWVSLPIEDERKDSRQRIATNGGCDNATETLESNRIGYRAIELKAKTEVRKKQITIHRENVARKRNPTARPKKTKENRNE